MKLALKSQLSIIKSCKVTEPVVVMLKPAPLPDISASFTVKSEIVILVPLIVIDIKRSVVFASTSQSKTVKVLPAPLIKKLFPDAATVDSVRLSSENVPAST